MRMKRIHSAAALGLTLLLGIGPAWAADPLYNPDPIPVPAKESQESVKNALQAVLRDKNWQVRQLAPGHMEAQYVDTGKGGKAYVAVIDLKYNAKAVTITYKDSKALDYNTEKGEIDAKYTRWVRALEKAIRKRLESYGSL